MAVCGPCGEGKHELCQPTSLTGDGYATCSCLHDRSWMAVSTNLAAAIEALNKGDIPLVKKHVQLVNLKLREM